MVQEQPPDRLVIEVAERVAQRKEQIGGYRIVEEPPFLRHFTAKLAPLG